MGTYDLVSYYLSDPLWDGGGCGKGNGCCAQIGMPWFYRKLHMTTAEDFEIRICRNYPITDEDTAFEKIELFVYFSATRTLCLTNINVKLLL